VGTKRFVWLGVFLLFAHLLMGQEKQRNTTVTAGVGFPELLNLGINYQVDRSHVGCTFGISPIIDDVHKKLYAVSGYYYYHFGNSAKIPYYRPWHVRTGLTFAWGETTNVKYQNLFFDTRFGRRFQINPRMGVDLNLGAAFLISEKENYENPPFLDLNWWLFPAIGLSLHYKL